MRRGIHTRVSPIAYETEYLEDARGGRAFNEGEIRRRKGMALSNVSALGARLNGLASFFAFGGISWVSYFDASGNLFVFEAPAEPPAAGDADVDCTGAQTGDVVVTGCAGTDGVAQNGTYSWSQYRSNYSANEVAWEWVKGTGETARLILNTNTGAYEMALYDTTLDEKLYSTNVTGGYFDTGPACSVATGQLTLTANAPATDDGFGFDNTGTAAITLS